MTIATRPAHPMLAPTAAALVVDSVQLTRATTCDRHQDFVVDPWHPLAESLRVLRCVLAQGVSDRRHRAALLSLAALQGWSGKHLLDLLPRVDFRRRGQVQIDHRRLQARPRSAVAVGSERVVRSAVGSCIFWVYCNKVVFFKRYRIIVPHDSENERIARTLQRLQSSSTGMTTRELARRLKCRPSDVNRDLLELQRRGEVTLVATRWKAVHARSEHAGNISRVVTEAQRLTAGMQLGDSSPAQSNDAAGSTVRTNAAPKVDRRHSRWATFRRLCDYYAECVRLDQRSSIHATADQEFKSIVCLDGLLPDVGDLRVRTRQEWHQWMQQLAGADYLFLGYPLQRFRWRDTRKKQDVTFVSPIFIVPCRTQIQGTDISISPIGSIRINEGWLERRLKNVEERRAFLELCGLVNDTDSDATAERYDWSECARFLQHF